MVKTGVGAPKVDYLDVETVAILSIISKDLEQIHLNADINMPSPAFKFSFVA